MLQDTLIFRVQFVVANHLDAPPIAGGESYGQFCFFMGIELHLAISLSYTDCISCSLQNIVFMERVKRYCNGLTYCLVFNFS